MRAMAMIGLAAGLGGCMLGEALPPNLLAVPLPGEELTLDTCREGLSIDGDVMRLACFDWQAPAPLEATTFLEAQGRCAALASGDDSWRLPTRRELHSLAMTASQHDRNDLPTWMKSGRYFVEHEVLSEPDGTVHRLSLETSSTDYGTIVGLDPKVALGLNPDQEIAAGNVACIRAPPINRTYGCADLSSPVTNEHKGENPRYTVDMACRSWTSEWDFMGGAVRAETIGDVSYDDWNVTQGPCSNFGSDWRPPTREELTILGLYLLHHPEDWQNYAGRYWAHSTSTDRADRRTIVVDLTQEFFGRVESELDDRAAVVDKSEPVFKRTARRICIKAPAF